MNKKLITLTIFAIIATLFAGFASAVVPNVAPYGNGLAYGYASYGSYPVNPQVAGVYYPYESQPVRIGGFFGGNSMFLHGLKPGFYDGPTFNYNTRDYLSGQYYPRANQYYPRAGGNFGYGTYNLRPSTFLVGNGHGMGSGYNGGYRSYADAPLPNTLAY